MRARTVACNNIACAYERGDGVKKDPGRATELWDKGCGLKSGLGCARVGRNRANATPPDWSGANTSFERSCELGYFEGCTRLATSYERGLGVPRDLARAAELYEKGCSLGDADACMALARQYDTGAGVEHDSRKAEGLRIRPAVCRRTFHVHPIDECHRRVTRGVDRS